MHPKRVTPGLTHEAAFWFQSFFAVLVRPALWGTAVRQVFRLARDRWWRRPPYLPVPDRRYVRFRLETAYGTDGERRAADLVRYLEWCRVTDRSRAS
jgi:hypothetical protein